MRITVSHRTSYTYAAPARGVIQLLRLTPRSSAQQHVHNWRIEVDRDCRLRPGEDALGNLTHGFEVDAPVDQLTVTVHGLVETQDTAGLVQGTVERFPPGLYLRETPLTRPDARVRELAQAVAATAAGDPLATLHGLAARIPRVMRFDPGTTDAQTTGAEALALGHGVCQDHAHVMIAAARSLGLPARYVSGYLWRADGQTAQEAGHAWAEAHVDGLGWVGFDPANAVSPTEAYIRLAIGLDYLGAAPIRGARTGGGREILDVRLDVAAAHQSQRQSQSQSGGPGQGQSQSQASA